MVAFDVVQKDGKENILLHNIVCKCGFVLGTEGHSVVTDSPTQGHCIDCGAVFKISSDIIIKKDDPEYEIE